VRIVPQASRQWSVWRLDDGRIHVTGYPLDADVIVMQRITHAHVAEIVGFLRRQGVAVVVDVDDLLSSIHPGNISWRALNPGAQRPNGRVAAQRLAGRRGTVASHLADQDTGYHQAWRNLAKACADATLVTVSSDALAKAYGGHGRVAVLPNLLAPHYFGHPHTDSEVVGWPGVMWSHPNDPQVTRPAISRLVREGVQFRVVGNPEGAGEAFGLPSDPDGTGGVDLLEWPKALAEHIGIGIVPLADTKFNHAKSFLKGAELAAAGVPFVASPRAEYRKLAKLGAGVLADDGQDWYRKLRRLLGSPALRAELSEAGRKAADEHLRLDAGAWRWAEAWERALHLQRASGTRRRPVAAPHPAAMNALLTLQRDSGLPRRVRVR
jgi:hypothetical protein